MANIIRKEEVHKISSIKEYSFSDIDSFLAVEEKGIKELNAVSEEFEMGEAQSNTIIHSEEIKKAEEEKFNLHKAVEAAIQKGHEEGFNQGLSEAKKTLEESINTVNRLAEELAAYKNKIINEAEEEVVKLALAISKKIIFEEPKQNPNIVKNIVKEAIKQLIDKDELVIKVNPQDLSSIKEIENQLFTTSAGICSKAKIIADDFITQGGCIVEARSGSVDADLKTQYEEVQSNLLGNKTDSNEESD